jgi:alanine racemase
VNASTAPTPPHRTWVEIDLEALRHNVAAVRAHLGERVQIMAVVKANAYGHGVGPVVAALAGRVEMFGVANLREAMEVREQLADAPVFILGPALPEERGEIVARRFVPAICSLEEARAYAALAGREPFEVHLKIDTGMGRVGIWESDAVAAAREILALPGLRVTGFASHLPVADEDDAFTREQLARFHRIASELRLLGLAQPVVHVENSAGIIGFPAQAEDMVRAGLMLYGSAPRAEFQPRLRAVMTWKTRITLLRTAPVGHGISYGRTFQTTHPTRVATLAVGYADGYQRHLSGRGAEVLIRGVRCPVLGRVTMDQIIAGVTALPELEVGEEVVLIGRQGSEEILAAELAEKAGTIAWEIFTGVGPRVERVYLFRIWDLGFRN